MKEATYSLTLVLEKHEGVRVTILDEIEIALFASEEEAQTELAEVFDTLGIELEEGEEGEEDEETS